MPTMTIMRGIPGSGKTTLAKERFPEAKIVSADDYFVDLRGVYRYRPAEIGAAHAYCFRLAIRAVEAEQDVVVDNTAMAVWEMSPYVLLAQTFGYDVRIIRVDCAPYAAAARNVHDVPEYVVFEMAKRMEPPLPFWPEEEVIETA